MEQLSRARGHTDLSAWLDSTRLWSTPLHHLQIVDAARAHALLRDGADLHAQAETDGPTPLSLARALHVQGAAAEGSTAALVLRAAQPWSPQTHALFPTDSRARAVEMLLMGHRLSRESRFEGESVAVLDVWMTAVMPHLVLR